MSKKKKQNKVKNRKIDKRKIKLKKEKNQDVKQKQKLQIEGAVDYAMYLTEKENYNDAKKILVKLYIKHPAHPHVLFGMGTISAFTGKLDEAVKYFDKVIAIDPYLLQAHFNKAGVYKKTKDTDNMVRAFQDVLKYGDSNHPLVLEAKKTLNSFDEHLKNYENMNLENYMKAGDLFREGFEYMENYEYESALELFKKSLEYNPNAYQCYGNLGTCLAAIGEKEKALAAFDRAIEIEPGYEPAILNRAIVNKLDKGQKLPFHGKSINYNSEYKSKKKSFIEEVLKNENVIK
ncbi:tetratricopeptide repeat protein [Desulfobacterales bacterium HSG17]|nr:tetratricopeptide repeat protein [Desulfobacterales bacterium HSG17]